MPFAPLIVQDVHAVQANVDNRKRKSKSQGEADNAVEENLKLNSFFLKQNSMSLKPYAAWLENDSTFLEHIAAVLNGSSTLLYSHLNMFE
jgi:hypothetical protein